MAMDAQTVSDRLAALSRAGLAHEAFAESALKVLGRAVPFESACLASCDPDTHLLTGTTKVGLPDARDAEFASFEYERPDVNSFGEIARRPIPVGVLALDTDGHPERAARYRDFLVPHFDQGNELRAALRADGRTWGLVGLYRPTSAPGFSPAEAAFVAGVSQVLAAGFRAGLIAGAAHQPDPVHGPAVLVVDPQDAVTSASGPAEQRLDQLGGSVWGALPIQLLAVVASARAFDAGIRNTPASTRVRARDGSWLVVHAAPLATPSGPSKQVVVTIEAARPPELIPLIVAAYQLTDRERDVVVAVLGGASTREIAGGLHLSPYTVQDHLKAVFTKCGVSSRRELIAKVFFNHYAPVIGQPLDTSGRAFGRQSAARDL